MYHERRHEELAPYTGLLQWLQQHQQDSDVSQFDSLARVTTAFIPPSSLSLLD